MSEHDHKTHEHAPEIAQLDTGARALDEALRSSFFIVRIVMVAMICVVIFSGVQTIGPQERGIKFRFGKAVGTGAAQLLGPGLHWAWPEPIEKIEKIPVTEIQKVTSTIGWFPLTPAMEAAGVKPTPVPSLNPASDGYLVMADDNIMHARATLGYRITDPVAYSFNFVNSSNTVLNAVNNALLYAAARTTADEALTNSTVFKERVLARVREEIDVTRLGITIEPGSEVKLAPPAYLQADFDAVNAAAQDSSKAILAAQGDAETTVRNAETDANLIVNAAESQRNSVVKDLDAFANTYAALLPQYQANPELIRERKLTEAWKRILGHADDSFISYLPAGQSELRLLLSREPLKPKSANP